jgi:hypothetical protein
VKEEGSMEGTNGGDKRKQVDKKRLGIFIEK